MAISVRTALPWIARQTFDGVNRHVRMPDTIRLQGIQDGIDDRRRRANRGRLPHTFGSSPTA